jgi:hypothetical protein
MGAYYASLMAVLASVALFGLLPKRCHAEDPAFVNKTFVGDDFFIGLFPHNTAWVGLQRSPDCAAWIDVASIATTNGVTEFVDLDARTSRSGFYRLCTPGFTVEDAQAKWSSRARGDCRAQCHQNRKCQMTYRMQWNPTMASRLWALAEYRARAPIRSQWAMPRLGMVSRIGRSATVPGFAVC